MREINDLASHSQPCAERGPNPVLKDPPCDLDGEPCGGCGAKTNAERCMGCLHDFGTPESAWVRTYYNGGYGL